MIPISLMRSLGLIALKCVLPERMLCMSAAEGDVMVMMNMILCSSSVPRSKQYHDPTLTCDSRDRVLLLR
jgi:hypothetical protein